MKKEIEFDVKKMLTLFESKSGHIKPIITEGEEPELMEDNDTNIGEESELKEDKGTDIMTKLTRVELDYKGMNCERSPALNDAELPGEAINAWGSIGNKLGKITNSAGQKISQSKITANTKFIPMVCGNYKLLVTNVIAPDDPNQLLVLRVSGEGKDKKYVYSQRPFPGLITRAKNYMEDDRNLNASQLMIRDILKRDGIRLTGAQIFDKKPTGLEDNEYEPIDLTTGRGVETGIEFLDPGVLNPDGLAPEFKMPGRFYMYVRKAAKAIKTDVVTNVENMLAQMGYTLNPNKLPNYQGETDVRVTADGGMITMNTLCAGGRCDKYPGLLDYINKFNGGNKPLYPFEIGGGTRDIVSANVSRRQTKKAAKKVAALGANRKTCRAIIGIYDNIINGGMSNDADIAGLLSSLYPGMNAGGVPNAMRKLGETLKNCSQSWRNVRLSKKDLAKIDVFINSSHKYAPNAAEVQKAAAKAKEEEKASNTSGIGQASPLSESISNSLRKVLKEHTKPNSDDIIKKSIRKNLKRLK